MTPKHVAGLAAAATFGLLCLTRLSSPGGGGPPPIGPAVAAAADAAPAKPAWFKGNLHTHSLWSDGDEFPERIAAWYRDRGYQFLAISDHNTLQQGERWLRSADLKKKGALPAAAQLLKDFPGLAKARGDVAGGTYEVRLTPFAEYKPALDRPGSFLLVPAEEVTDKAAVDPADKTADRAVHMGAINVAGEPVKPAGGRTVVEVIRANFRAIMASGERDGRPVLAHLNHPNFRWGVTAEEMAAVVEERFFEVYNGHPGVNHNGSPPVAATATRPADPARPGTERMWDLANAMRLTALNAPPLYGIGTDDSHSYHVPGMNRATPGRGWVCVRAAALSADALVVAMKAGDFYASSGVSLADVRYDVAVGTLTVKVEPDGDAKHKIRFVGTLAPAAGATAAPGAAPGAAPAGSATVDPAAVGVELAAGDGPEATYTLTGKELYVRAVVTADRPPAVPSFKGQLKQAWTQPVGWEKRVK